MSSARLSPSLQIVLLADLIREVQLHLFLVLRLLAIKVTLGICRLALGICLCLLDLERECGRSSDAWPVPVEDGRYDAEEQGKESKQRGGLW